MNKNLNAVEKTLKIFEKRETAVKDDCRRVLIQD
jgi:hypothetical protein